MKRDRRRERYISIITQKCREGSHHHDAKLAAVANHTLHRSRILMMTPTRMAFLAGRVNQFFEFKANQFTPRSILTRLMMRRKTRKEAHTVNNNNVSYQ
jgi:hypothetical protein